MISRSAASFESSRLLAGSKARSHCVGVPVTDEITFDSVAT